MEVKYEPSVVFIHHCLMICCIVSFCLFQCQELPIAVIRLSSVKVGCKQLFADNNCSQYFIYLACHTTVRSWCGAIIADSFPREA
jgi:hypothetical protein